MKLLHSILSLFKRKAKIGDYVQWECNGAYQFSKPRKVLGLEKDASGRTWAFVQGTKTGLPAEQLVVEKPS